jgi:hypothetical protein
VLIHAHALFTFNLCFEYFFLALAFACHPRHDNAEKKKKTEKLFCAFATEFAFRTNKLPTE